MMNKYLVLTLLILVLPMVMATSIETKTSFVKAGDKFIIEQYCANSTYANISSIKTTSSNLLGETAMVEISNDYYQYNFTNTYSLGYYTITYHCDENGETTGGKTDFEVTATGSDFSSQKSTMYTTILILSIILFFGLLYVGISAPYNNKRDEMTGYIISVSNLKYVKLVCLGFAWIFAVFISYLSWMLSYSYLDMGFLADTMKFIFYFVAVATLPLFILFVYLTIANLVRDSKISEALQRGFDIQ